MNALVLSDTLTILVDPPGLAPADLTLLEYKNIPWDIYPIGDKYKN